MPDDVVEFAGLAVTTPLRTACDLGRLLHRDQALAALDSLLRRDGFSQTRLLAEVVRFRGMRGVRQLRELAPLADARSESPGESILRLRWLDCSDLPRPTPQVEVPGRGENPYRLDLGIPELRYAGEYDGAEWHAPERAVADRARRAWIAESDGWMIDAFRGPDVHGRTQCAEVRLRRAILPLLARRRSTAYIV